MFTLLNSDALLVMCSNFVVVVLTHVHPCGQNAEAREFLPESRSLC
jgi:hypothetical protein